MGLLDKIFKKKETVTVEFYNSKDGSLIGTSDMPVSQLPDTFEVATTMSLHGEEWSVQEAIPMRSEEFQKSKKLTLRMSKIEYMNPNDLLYSLPTISNELPGRTDETPFSAEPFSIQEDDWRQFEFLRKESTPLIEVECSKIEQLKKEFSKEVDESFTAYTNCHVRDVIGYPGLDIKLSELTQLLNSEEIGGLKFHGDSGFVEGGFSIPTASSVFFGLVKNEIVHELCIGNLTDGTRNEIQSILQRFDLLFVNWYHAEVISKDD